MDTDSYGELYTEEPLDHPEKDFYPVFIKTGYSGIANPDDAEGVPPTAEINSLL